MPVAPILNAKTKESAFSARHTRWNRRSPSLCADTAIPREISTPIPTQPAKILGLSKKEVIRTPASTPVNWE